MFKNRKKANSNNFAVMSQQMEDVGGLFGESRGRQMPGKELEVSHRRSVEK
jgi:hypothetical protein